MIFEQIVGVVLCGGKSSRMGKDKSALTIKGNSLLEITKNCLHEAGLKKVLLSTGQMHTGQMIAGQMHTGQMSAGQKKQGIPDIVADKGPMGGMYSVLSSGVAEDAKGFIFVPVDMPLLNKEVIVHLIKQCQISLSNGELVNGCFYQGQPMPCYIENNARVKRVLEELIDQNQLAIKVLLKRITAKVLSHDSAFDRRFANVNTPEDWRKLDNLIEKSEKF